MERYLMATNAGSRNNWLEEYFWYPKAKEAEIREEQKCVVGENTNFQRSAGIFYLDSEIHVLDYERWHDALTNKLQTFKKPEFMFNEKSIHGFKPAGFILFVKNDDPTLGERLTSMRTLTGKSKKEFAAAFKIPYRTYQDWELGNNMMAEYIFDLIAFRVKNDPTLY